MRYICVGGPRDGWEGNLETPWPRIYFPEGKYARRSNDWSEPIVYQYVEEE
jgi:hypothetical protein